MIRNIHRSRLVGAAVVTLVATFLAASAGPAAAGDLFPLQRNVGGGALTGSVTYTNGTQVNPVLGGCQSTTFDVSIDATGLVLNTVGSGYLGTINLTGTGAAPCDTAYASGGSLDLAASSVGPTGSQIDCPSVTGSYIRLATRVQAALAGDCLINNFPTQLRVLVEAEWVPTAGDGVTSPVTAAALAGTWTSVPV